MTLRFARRYLAYRLVGGLHFWRIGRLGGSFYLTHRSI